MGIRAFTMIKHETGQVFRQLFFLIGKISLVIFFTMAVGWGWAYFLLKANVFDSFAIKIAVLLMAAIFSGFFSRLIMKQHGQFLSWLTAFLSLVISLIDLNNLSDGRVGFNLFQYNNHVFNWNGIWQLLSGALITLAALIAWRKPDQRSTRAVQTNQNNAVSSNERITPASNKTRSSMLSKNNEPKKTSGRTTTKKRLPNAVKTDQLIRKYMVTKFKGFSKYFSGLNTRINNVFNKTTASVKKITEHTSRSVPTVKFQRAPRLPQKIASQAALETHHRLPKERHSPIHLVGREEHRCPYCLCSVSSRDPGGVVICPVCHTYHHKSCWDVTGACQVPHIHG